MRLFISAVLAGLIVSCVGGGARAQNNLTVVQTCGTLPLAYKPGAVRTATQDVNGLACSSASIVGGGDATAANQALQITQETALNTALGLQADAACATDNGACTLLALVKRTNQRLTTINTTLGTPMQATGGTVGLVAGSAIIGNIRIDQTTPGTTNAVQANAGTNLNTSALALEAGNLATLAGIVSSARAAVDPISGQVGVQGGAGASTALTQRVAFATDANTVQLAANQSVNVAQINGVTPLMGNGATGTGAVRVSIANDSTGIVALPAAGTSIVGAKAPGTAGATSALIGAVYNSTPPTLTDGQQASVQADTTGAQYISTEGRKATYSAAATVIPSAAATDVFTLTGSASKTIRVRQIKVGGIATAASAAVINVVKRSAAATGGTSVAVTATPYDSVNAAASGTVLNYSANPTAGALVGIIDQQYMTLTTAAGAIPLVPLLFNFSGRGAQSVVLRGAGDVAAVNFNGATITGASLTILIEWTEE